MWRWYKNNNNNIQAGSAAPLKQAWDVVVRLPHEEETFAADAFLNGCQLTNFLLHFLFVKVKV